MSIRADVSDMGITNIISRNAINNTNNTNIKLSAHKKNKLSKSNNKIDK